MGFNLLFKWVSTHFLSLLIQLHLLAGTTHCEEGTSLIQPSLQESEAKALRHERKKQSKCFDWKSVGSNF